MAQKAISDPTPLAYILSDPSLAESGELRSARDAILDAVGSTAGEFSQPAFIDESLLPSLFKRFMSWQSLSDLPHDPSVTVHRFSESVRNYARQMKGQQLFKRILPSSHYVEVTYERHLSLGSRYSSVPPTDEDSLAVHDAASGVDADLLLRFMSDQIIEEAQAFMVSFTRLADSGLGCEASKVYVVELSEAFEALKQKGSRALAPFLQLLFQQQTRVHLRAFMYRFEDWFFGAFMDSLGRWQSEGLELYEAGDMGGLVRIGDGISEQYNIGHDYLRFINEVREKLAEILNMDVGRPYRESWSGYIMRSRTLGHDYGNPLMSLLSASFHIKRIANGDDSETSRGVLDALMRPFDVSSTASLVDMVFRMARNDAKRAEVVLESMRIDELEVPHGYRASLFRIIHEFVRNAIKYHDEGKDERFVKVDARRDGRDMVITVEDNGVGIKDTEEVMRWGARERPELASGTGVGLANARRLAEGNGWRVELNSRPSVCTEAKLYMPVGSWDPGAPYDGSLGESGVEPEGAALAGATHAAGLTAASVETTAFAASASAFLSASLL